MMAVIWCAFAVVMVGVAAVTVRDYIHERRRQQAAR
jgi:hypothetical protein